MHADAAPIGAALIEPLPVGGPPLSESDTSAKAPSRAIVRALTWSTASWMPPTFSTKRAIIAIIDGAACS
jgi:hypothetical protein